MLEPPRQTILFSEVDRIITLASQIRHICNNPMISGADCGSDRKGESAKPKLF